MASADGEMIGMGAPLLSVTTSVTLGICDILENTKTTRQIIPRDTNGQSLSLLGAHSSALRHPDINHYGEIGKFRTIFLISAMRMRHATQIHY